jgi:glutamate synthase domain-containing protein 3
MVTNKKGIDQTAKIDASDISYKELNARIKDAASNGVPRIELRNVCGQRYIGTGMHGGVIYLRNVVDGFQLGKEVGVGEMEERDYQVLQKFVEKFAAYFDYDAREILKHRFIKLFPLNLRPYGRLYAY